MSLKARNGNGYRFYADEAGAAVVANAGFPLNRQRAIVHHGHGGANHVANLHRFFDGWRRVTEQRTLQDKVLRGHGVCDDHNVQNGLRYVVVGGGGHVIAAHRQRHGVVAVRIGGDGARAGAAYGGDRSPINTHAAVLVGHGSGQGSRIYACTAPVNDGLHRFQAVVQGGDGFKRVAPEGGAIDAAIFVHGCAIAVVANKGHFCAGAWVEDVSVVSEGIGQRVGAETAKDSALAGDAGVAAGIICRRSQTEVIAHEGRQAPVVMIILRADEQTVAVFQPGAQRAFARRARSSRAAKLDACKPDNGGVGGQFDLARFHVAVIGVPDVVQQTQTVQRFDVVAAYIGVVVVVIHQQNRRNVARLEEVGPGDSAGAAWVHGNHCPAVNGQRIQGNA